MPNFRHGHRSNHARIAHVLCEGAHVVAVGFQTEASTLGRISLKPIVSQSETIETNHGHLCPRPYCHVLSEGAVLAAVGFLIEASTLGRISLEPIVSQSETIEMMSPNCANPWH